MATQTPRELLAALKQGTFAPAWYFHGPEDTLKDEALRYLVERALDPGFRDLNLDVRSAAQLDPESLETLCGTLPMMAERRVVVVRDVEQWKRKSRAKEAMLRALDRPSAETVIVLIQSGSEAAEDRDLSRRAVSVAFAALSPAETRRWLTRRAAAQGVTFGEGAAEHLLEATGGNLAALQLEVEKLSALPPGTPVTPALVGGLVGVRSGETPRDWRDAVLDGDAPKALRLLEAVLAQSGVTGVRLVGLLGTALTGIGVARAALDRGLREPAVISAVLAALREARPMGLGSWDDEARRWTGWAHTWPPDRIGGALRAALAADRALKGTTLSTEEGVLTDLILRVAVGEPVTA